MACFIVVERYNYLVNGEAESDIKQFMAVEHTFEEYTEVRLNSAFYA